jgi:glycerol-3-phosphate dehydrogenase
MNREAMVIRLRARTEPWDIVVIGGGATGAGIAVDAASRGYAVLLLEREDFGKGTSSRSTKLVHGGVRYLEQGNVSLVMEALKERGMLLENAPHLVHDLPFVVPNYSWWETPFYGIGLKIYDLLAGKYGFGRSRILSLQETLERLPTIRQDGLRGGVIYHDGQFDDARLLIALMMTAAEQGATVLNYAPVLELTRDADGFINGVLGEDRETGFRFTAEARVVINATGIFADQVRRLAEPAAAPMLAPSQGIHLVFEKSFLRGNTAIMVPHTSDGRVLFAIPWHNHTLVGTTDTPIAGPSYEPMAFDEEIEFVLETAAQYLSRPPRREDILSVFVGIRPLVKAEGAASGKTSTLSRDHTIHIDSTGLLTIVGGKWTTYRHMAEDAVNQAATLGRLADAPCITRNLRIHRPLPRLLQEPRHRRDPQAPRRNSPSSPASNAHIDAMFTGEKINTTETAPSCTSPCARPKESKASSSTAKTSFPVCTKSSTRWPPSPTASAAASGKATPASASATSSTSASAAPTSAPSWPTKPSSTTAARPHLPLRLQRRRHRLRRSHRDLDPDETLFIISSKTFTTLETMTNAHTARDWSSPASADEKGHRQALRRRLHQRRGSLEVRHRHRQHVRLLGLGRRPLLHGLRHRPLDHDRHRPDNFRAMLAGFHAMDEHFRTAPFEKNLPVLLGCSPSGTPTSSTPRPSPFCPTSNTSSASPPTCSSSPWRATASTSRSTATHVDYQTGPIYWGEPGTNGQHSFYQLIHQGTRLIPCDFIGFAKTLNPLGRHHDMLMANVFAQAEALAFGKTAEQVKAEGTPDWLVPHKRLRGQPPLEHHPRRRSRPNPRQARRPLRAQRLHPGRHLADRLVRPVGRGAGQGPRPAIPARPGQWRQVRLRPPASSAPDAGNAIQGIAGTQASNPTCGRLKDSIAAKIAKKS